MSDEQKRLAEAWEQGRVEEAQASADAQAREKLIRQWARAQQYRSSVVAKTIDARAREVAREEADVPSPVEEPTVDDLRAENAALRRQVQLLTEGPEEDACAKRAAARRDRAVAIRRWWETEQGIRAAQESVEAAREWFADQDRQATTEPVKNQCTACKATFDANEKAIAELKAQLEAEKAKSADLEKRIGLAEKDRAVLERRLEQAEQTVAACQTTIRVLSRLVN